MTFISREVHLVRRPTGTPSLEDFAFERRTLSAPADGQLLVKNQWISVDPYMRGRMIDKESYIPPFQLGEAMDGAAIGVVEQSGHPDFAPGDIVAHFSGWRDAALVDGAGANKVDVGQIPAQAYLGVLGFPGLAAYAGLLRIGQPKAGETVFVSAASGAVGSAVAQIAKLKGCRVIASAGSDEKTAWLLKEAGVDAVINYKTTEDLTAALADAAPNGIDIYFDNVGGAHLDAAIAVANTGARFVLCGMIGQYNAEQAPAGPSNIYEVIVKRLNLTGLLVSDHVDLFPDFMRDMAQWIGEGKIKWQETIVDGLDNAPRAFLGLFNGSNLGKMVVKI